MKKRGTLIILSCHEEARLREYSDVIVLMEDGKIVDTEEK